MGRRILIAEDSATQAKRLRMLLEGAGYLVDLAVDGSSALESVRSAPPDLIISDVVMPNMDGYAFCRAVRKSAETKRIPFVLLTERGAPEDIILGLENGADNFIVKPFDDADLLERIRRIFEHLDLRERETLVVEITLRFGGRDIVITADKQQIMELLFATAERLGRVNAELERSQQALKEHVGNLEGKVQERTKELNESLESLRRTDEERRRLLSRLLKAQEEERQRIAADIHDDSIQVMSAVGIRLELLQRTVDDADQLKLLEYLQETVTLTTARLRNLLFELRPPALDREGLGPALHAYLEQHQEDGAPTYRLENRLTVEPPTDTRVILYRISQEVLANVRKHARASAVDILIDTHDDGFLVRITDDGIGFSAADENLYRPGHIGLVSIREQAEMAGGWCRIQSAPKGGTTVEFWLPALSPRDAES